MNNALANKIKQIILEDRQSSLLAFEKSLKSDLYSILCDYINNIDDINISINTDNFAVRLDISVIGNSIQKVGNIL